MEDGSCGRDISKECFVWPFKKRCIESRFCSCRGLSYPVGMFEAIEKVKQDVQTAAGAIKTAQELEQFRIRFLGGNGEVKKLLAMLKEVPAEQKRDFGKQANECKAWVETQYEALRSAVGATGNSDGGTGGGQSSGGIGVGASGGVKGVDVTEPGVLPGLGRSHVITQTIDELVDVFGRMGFEVATGPEVEDEWHNFIALNIPESHPARDPLDNFYIEVPEIFGGAAGSRGTMLRSQTSTIQIRVLENRKPPVRVIATGRVYRPDEHDATHFSMFHQIEGLYIDRGVSMTDLKTTLFQFARAYFGPEAEVRFRPSYFPFTEPSAEFDIKMMLGGQWQWKEIGGCGMVNPAVLEACKLDPQEWTGFAFGLGIERLAMRKYGIQDIRWLFENDVRFLKQF